jgi:hypothetical protein
MKTNVMKIIEAFKPKKKTLFLGRWGKVEGSSLMKRIDLSNEDHCHCNEYIRKKLEGVNQNSTIK